MTVEAVMGESHHGSLTGTQGDLSENAFKTILAIYYLAILFITVYDTILTCAQKLTKNQLSLMHLAKETENKRKQEKSARRRRKHCALAVVSRSQTFHPAADPLPGGA